MEGNITKIAVLVEHGKNMLGERVPVYTMVEDGQRRGGDVGGNPSLDSFVASARALLDVVAAKGERPVVTIDESCDKELSALARHAASLI